MDDYVQSHDYTELGNAKKQYDIVKKELRESESWYLRSQSAKGIQAMLSLTMSLPVR